MLKIVYWVSIAMQGLQGLFCYREVYRNTLAIEMSTGSLLLKRVLQGLYSYREVSGTLAIDCLRREHYIFKRSTGTRDCLSKE